MPNNHDVTGMTDEKLMAILADTYRYELVDHAFGDAEVNWRLEDGETIVADAYFGGKLSYIHFEGVGFSVTGDDCYKFRNCGELKAYERNDSMDD